MHQTSLSQLESHLWESANILRGPVDAADFKTYIFPLLFFKRICDVWDEEYEEIVADTGDAELALFPESHRFQIPDGCHWNDVRAVATNVGNALQRAMREIEVAIPVSLALLPAHANRGHVLMSYTSALIHEPTIVPFARPSFEGGWGNGILRFQTPRLGTFQAVVADTAGASRMREYKFRGVTGFSMGAIGSAQLGLRHPDIFDFSAPLGGPTDFIQTIHYFREYNFGGFCTEAERGVPGNDCDAGSSEARTPPRKGYFEFDAQPARITE